MPLTPGYGETPLPDDELQALLPAAREALGEPLTKAAVYDLEQAIQEDVPADCLTLVLERALRVDEILDDHFVRQRHDRLYGALWSWAGRFRRHEVSIGVAPENLAVEVRGSLDAIRFRWDHTRDWTPKQLGDRRPR